MKFNVQIKPYKLTPGSKDMTGTWGLDGNHISEIITKLGSLMEEQPNRNDVQIYIERTDA